MQFHLLHCGYDWLLLLFYDNQQKHLGTNPQRPHILHATSVLLPGSVIAPQGRQTSQLTFASSAALLSLSCPSAVTSAASQWPSSTGLLLLSLQLSSSSSWARIPSGVYLTVDVWCS